MDSTRSQSAGKTLEVSEIERGWLAGLIDGEGNVSLHKHVRGRKIPRCTVINTDFSIIERYADILKRLGIGCYINHQDKKRYGENWNNTKSAEVQGFKRFRALVEEVLPHLTGIKKVKAETALAFVYSRLMKPGEGRGIFGEYDATELYLIDLLLNGFKGNPNEYTPEWIDHIHKIYSDLHRQYAEAAEMTARP